MPTSSSPCLIIRGSFILPDRILEEGAMLCRNGEIAAIGKRVATPRGAIEIEVRGGHIAPGYIDIHVHGGGGADFMDGTSEAVRLAARAHARRGTTTLFPTTTTGSPERITAMLVACREVRDSWNVQSGSRITGVHVYGPYFAEEKAGCHDRQGCRSPDRAEYSAWFRDDLVRIATCAAELPGAEAFYRAAKKRGCFVTCGHSNANWSEMSAAFRAGMRHVDHFWCAMSGVVSLRTRFGTPMQAGMEQFVLAHEEMSTEVIADGEHLSPELLEFAYRMKGASRLCLVSDSSRALDMPPGTYRFGCNNDGPEFESDGRVGRSGGSLASSVQALDHMVRIMKRDTSASLPDVIRMASLTPAERTGIADRYGSLEVGKAADFNVLNRRLEVKRTFIGGKEITSR